MTVCIDASVLVKLVVSEQGSARAHSWFVAHQDDRLIAPPILQSEVTSALSRKVYRALISPEQALEALRLLAGLDVSVSWDQDLAERALTLAIELRQPSAYDTAYLALAEREKCELLTGDAAFARACGTRYPFVRVL